MHIVFYSVSYTVENAVGKGEIARVTILNSLLTSSIRLSSASNRDKTSRELKSKLFHRDQPTKHSKYRRKECIFVQTYLNQHSQKKHFNFPQT